jgi:tRNA-dihydrouridine synthase A
MFDAPLVGRICQEIIMNVKIPLSVKCRLGVDDLDKYEDIHNFISVVSSTGGVNKFIIHARKCHLKGLNPHQNRNIPELKYEWVYKLKQDFPHLAFIINGGFTEIDKVTHIH